MKRPRAFARPLSVLVVDGYPDAAASLALVLTSEGFAARFALSGEKALAAAAAEPPQVVVVEPRTPGGGGSCSASRPSRWPARGPSWWP